jgi:uncharacterized phage protein gp47/JayE
MPWTTPTLNQVRQMVRNDVTTSLQGASLVGNTVLRVMADAMAGLASAVLRYIDWLATQLMPDTATDIWLDRHGVIWLKNSDGSKGRKSPTAAQGAASFTGTPGVVVPEGMQLAAANGAVYETLEAIQLPDVAFQPQEVAVRAINPGAATNQVAGTTLAPMLPIAGVDSSATVVDLRGGSDIETDDELRARVLARIQQPPMGGDADDYVQWAMSIPSVTRAWCAPREMGMGTITVRFMVDALRADTGGFPTQDDLNVVAGYLDTMRPVAVRDFFVAAPVPEPIDFNLALINDSLTLRQQVSDSVAAMISQRAQPAHAVNGQLVAGTTILASWISEAIGRVTNDFELDMDDHPMPHNGALAVLGTITYPVP